MERVGFLLRIRPGTEAEYRRRHQAVFPDLLAAFQRHGIRTYSIFMHGTTLFAYMEVEDFDRVMKLLEQEPANQRWRAFMADIVVTTETGSTIEKIPEVFHFSSPEVAP